MHAMRLALVLAIVPTVVAAAPVPTDRVALDLTTGGLVPAVRLVDDPLGRALCAITIRGTVRADGTGTGTVLLDHRKPTFNAFGDLTGTAGPAPKPLDVTFVERKSAPEKAAGRRQFAIVFADGVFANQLF